MLNTILFGQFSDDGFRIAIREDTSIPLFVGARFVTHLQDVNGNYYLGNYNLTMPEAYNDYLNRCEEEKTAPH